jgi:hypothetical protein
MSYTAYPTGKPDDVIARRGGSTEVDYNVVCRRAAAWSSMHLSQRVEVHFYGQTNVASDLLVRVFVETEAS